jgi:hypothetical protein
MTAALIKMVSVRCLLERTRQLLLFKLKAVAAIFGIAGMEGMVIVGKRKTSAFFDWV